MDGWPNQRFALIFPRWLAADSAVRAEYIAVKRRAEAAAAGIDDPAAAGAAYVGAKEPWFDDAYVRALEWNESRTVQSD